MTYEGQWGAMTGLSPASPTSAPFASDEFSAATLPLTGVLRPFDMFAEEPSVAWVRDGNGLLGWGLAAQEHFVGPERFSRAQAWFADWVHRHLGAAAAAAAPVAFASFTFDDNSPGSVVTVPETLVAVAGNRARVIYGDADYHRSQPARPTDQLMWRDDPTSQQEWKSAVANAVKRISAGELDKVVLARGVDISAPEPIPIQQVLTHLSASYPDCWTFSVDGLVGATPELLVRRQGSAITSRVLAGTVRSGDSLTANERKARALRGSAKDLAEHEYAVRSVSHALAVHCTDLQVADRPSVLTLANVQHLATDITGRLVDNSSAVALAASLHPTAAVCGTPSERAEGVIADLETIDRGRYSGPVGWFDHTGNGEFGIALRCGQFSPDRRSAVLYAGCGLVADSDPAAELAESEAKLEAMRTALF